MRTATPQEREQRKRAAQARWDKTSPEERKAFSDKLNAAVEQRFDDEVNRVDPKHQLSEEMRAELRDIIRTRYYADIVAKRRATMARQAESQVGEDEDPTLGQIEHRDARSA